MADTENTENRTRIPFMHFDPLTRFQAWVSGAKEQRAKEQRGWLLVDQLMKAERKVGATYRLIEQAFQQVEASYFLTEQARPTGAPFDEFIEILNQLHQLRLTMSRIVEKAEKTQAQGTWEWKVMMAELKAEDLLIEKLKAEASERRRKVERDARKQVG